MVFDNKNWLEISESGLIAEIPEQILKDGANFEAQPNVSFIDARRYAGHAKS